MAFDRVWAELDRKGDKLLRGHASRWLEIRVGYSHGRRRKVTETFCYRWENQPLSTLREIRRPGRLRRSGYYLLRWWWRTNRPGSEAASADEEE